MKLSLFILLFISTTLISCTSDKVKEVNTQLTQQESSSKDTTVGVNEDGNMVIQKNVNLAKELRRLEQNINESEDRLFGTREYNTTGLRGQLQKCAATKPVEEAKLYDTESFDRISDTDHVLNLVEDREAGTDSKSGKLVVQSEEKLSAKIKKLTKYRAKLIAAEDDIQSKLTKCKASK